MHDYFGEEVAARYDASSAEMFDPAVVDPAVDFLAGLAGGGPRSSSDRDRPHRAPLAARGVTVRGIELSEAMAAQLRAKPGADAIEVTVGDFATTRVDGTFSLVYLVFNTIIEPHHPGAQVDVLPQRRGPPRARRSS